MNSRQDRAHFWIVALAAAAVFFVNLGAPRLWDEDEPKNAVCAREMLERGDWIVPTFNQQLRTDKPILLYWLTLCSYHAFGVGEFAARFPSALLSVGTVLLTARLGRRLFSARAGTWGGVVLASCLLFAVSARAATPDATLIFFTTAALATFAGVWSSNLPAARFELRLGNALRLYGLLGLAVLAKGPVGFLLPAAGMVITVWLGGLQRPLSMRRIAARLFDSLVRLKLLPGAGISLLIALPWYVTVGIETDWQWTAGFLQKHNVSRFLEPLEGHSGSLLYYFPVILLGVTPWSLPVMEAIRQSVLRLRARDGAQASDLLLLTWIGTYLVFFSVARTKLPSYVLPCYPALAVLTGRVIDGWLAHAEAARSRVWRQTFAGGCVLGLVVGAGGLFAGPAYLEGEPALALLGLVPALGSGIAWLLLQRERAGLAACAFGATAAMFQMSLLGLAGAAISRQQVSEPFARVIRAAAPDRSRVAALNFFPPSLAFYTQGRVEQFRESADALQYLRDHTDGFLVVREEQAGAVLSQLPQGVVILERRPLFLRPRQAALLIGRKPHAAAAQQNVVDSAPRVTMNAN